MGVGRVLVLAVDAAVALSAPPAALSQFSMDDDSGMPAAPAPAPGPVTVDEDIAAPANRAAARLSLSSPFSESAQVGHTVLATSGVVSNKVVASDASLVHVTGTGITPHVNQIQGNGGVITVSSRGMIDSPTGKTAEIVGGVTDSKGTIVHDNVSMRSYNYLGADRVNTGHVIAEYWSADGDSGAPVIHTDSGGKAHLLGIHVGSMSWFTVESSGAVVSHFPLHDINVRDGQYGVFAPWGSVARDLGIQ